MLVSIPTTYSPRPEQRGYQPYGAALQLLYDRAPEVVLSWAQRDEGGPVIPSRFVLRVEAMLGDLAEAHRERGAVELARVIDHAPLLPPYPQPKPSPSAEQRAVPPSIVIFLIARSTSSSSARVKESIM